MPITEDENYRGSDKLKGKAALVTGGDSGAPEFSRQAVEKTIETLACAGSSYMTGQVLHANGGRIVNG